MFCSITIPSAIMATILLPLLILTPLGSATATATMAIINVVLFCLVILCLYSLLCSVWAEQLDRFILKVVGFARSVGLLLWEIVVWLVLFGWNISCWMFRQVVWLYEKLARPTQPQEVDGFATLDTYYHEPELPPCNFPDPRRKSNPSSAPILTIKAAHPAMLSGSPTSEGPRRKSTTPSS
ncbi:hypothetical protein GE09DRAFT_553279 [Coniochaeta sp. 2T2.1]|nr:hypothetical protein GE09DRAFT_553279 [Coniochaeta sp. 2T2.1]